MTINTRVIRWCLCGGRPDVFINTENEKHFIQCQRCKKQTALYKKERKAVKEWNIKNSEVNHE